MKRFIIPVVLILMSVVVVVPSMEDDGLATCRGGSPCNACKNCRYCKHCSKNGGTCGVCSSGEIKPIESEERMCKDKDKH